MHASPFDFVSVLSAEECCPVCRELHATVDQCECSGCGINTCPDCASLRPDTRWVCASCVVHSPSRVVVSGSPPLWQRVRKVRISLHELTVEQSSLVSRGLSTLRFRGLAAWTLLRAAWVTLGARLAALLVRGLTQGGKLVQHFVVRLGSPGQWRQHASSLLIAIVILIAVARSETCPDAR